MPKIKTPTIRTYLAATGGLPWGLIHPRRRDTVFLDQLTDVGVPSGRVVVSLEALPQVARPVPTPFVAEGLMAPRRTSIALTAFAVRHPDVTFLVDPGICTHVVKRAISELTPVLRLAVTPPTDVLDLRASLEQAELAESELAFALPTHLHWDHVSGLLDLPDLPIRLHTIERAWAMNGPTAPVGGVRSAVLGRPTEEYTLDGPPVLTFRSSHDLFGDGSVILVDLGGHTPGSIGVLLRTAEGPVLLAGDAAWHGRQIEHLRPKASFPGRFVDDDRPETFRTLHRLHAIRHDVRIVATHDHDAAQELRHISA